MATEAEYEQARREHEFMTAILEARDMLEPIVSGKIERGHCLPGKHTAYLDEPGKRKTTLADAKKIAKTVQWIINRAIDKYDGRGDEG
jgi:hypothetical protein